VRKLNYQLNVGKILRESFDIILRKPVILLPMFIALLFDRIIYFVTLSFFDSAEKVIPLLTASLISLFLFIIIYPVVEGMYPLMVKNILENKEIELNNAFSLVLKKAQLLITAGILIDLIIFAGILLLIVPGVIFAIRYFYTIPAIMLENHGVLDGMRASKEFARDKKIKTFLFLLIPLLFSLFGDLGTRFVFSSFQIASETARFVFSLIIFTWFAIIPAYVYIKKEI